MKNLLLAAFFLLLSAGCTADELSPGRSIENFNLIQQTQKALADTEQQSQRLAALNEISEKLGQAETLDDI